MSDERMESLDECTVRADGRYRYLDSRILDVAGEVLKSNSHLARDESVRRFMGLFGQIGEFCVHFGGAEDALLLLSTFYDEFPGRTVVSISNSSVLARSLFDAFPSLTKVYLPPYPDEFIIHVILRKLFGAMLNYRGMGRPRGIRIISRSGDADLTSRKNMV